MKPKIILLILSLIASLALGFFIGNANLFETKLTAANEPDFVFLEEDEEGNRWEQVSAIFVNDKFYTMSNPDTFDELPAEAEEIGTILISVANGYVSSPKINFTSNILTPGTPLYYDKKADIIYAATDRSADYFFYGRLKNGFDFNKTTYSAYYPEVNQ